MADPFLGEIRPFAFTYAPRGWAFCSGQLLPINQNQALFSLLGTNYGGNGQTTFGLPDLRGRVAVGVGQGPGLSSITLGQVGGAEGVTLTAAEIPSHNHAVNVSGPASTPTAAGNFPGQHLGTNIYGPPSGETLAADSLTGSGQSQAHPNMQPYMGTNYAICLSGIFPPHN